WLSLLDAGKTIINDGQNHKVIDYSLAAEKSAPGAVIWTAAAVIGTVMSFVGGSLLFEGASRVQAVCAALSAIFALVALTRRTSIHRRIFLICITVIAVVLFGIAILDRF
ncbi:MAG TPA: hypothetical protein VHM90_09480, partial [Phycisphaerae bacterium]|nr:hypothetical protein [Phycisphaerae bacterium]